MIEYIKEFLDFIFDATKSLFSRLMILALFLIGIYLVDDYFQFSYNYRLNSRIEQIREIESIVKETSDSTIKKSLKKTEYELLNSSNLFNYFSLSFERNVNRISSINSKVVTAISPNPIFHYVFSNVFLIVFMLWSIRSGFKKKKFGMIVLSIVLTIGIFFIFIFWATGALTALTSIITDNVYIKFLLIIFVQPIIVFFFYSIDAVKEVVIKVFNDIRTYWNV